LQDGYLMVIPAMINGIGPFNFLLDTGTTQTVIDPDLARQLQTPTIGDVAITTVLHMRQDKLVQLRDVSLGHSSVAGWERSSINWRGKRYWPPAFVACWARISIKVRHPHRLQAALAAPWGCASSW
jgi:hypothetical protein